MNILNESQRQIVNILKVFIGNNNGVPVIVWPLMRTDESSYDIIVINMSL
jgi:hypothetical protein